MPGEVLHGPDYFPALTPAGDTAAHLFASSPAGGAESMHPMYLLAINTLTDALKRGVRIIVPGEHMDAETVRRASRAGWGDLLAAGAEIYEYAPTMFHCKALIVDGYLVSVGSTNFDTRSFRLNDEANLNIDDRRFAARMTAVFETDLAHARRISHEAWWDPPVVRASLGTRGPAAARPVVGARRPGMAGSRGRTHHFLHEHSLSLTATGILVLWTGLYLFSSPDTHLGSFFGNAIADWAGVVVTVLATKHLYEKGSTAGLRAPRHLLGPMVRFLRDHLLTLFLLLTGIGWAVVYAVLDSESKWGQVVGNLVSEWTQILAFAIMTKALIERDARK